MVDILSLLPPIGGELDDTAISDHYSAGVSATWLRVNFVSSVDGAATVDGKSGALGSDADRRVFDILRTLCDVVLVASGTVKAEKYGAMVVDEDAVQLRLANGLKQQPVFAIVSASLDLDPTSDVFAKAPVRPIIFTVESAPASARDALSKVADVIVCGSESVDLPAMRKELIERTLTRIHCEGGPSLFGSLLAADLVDELCLTVSPQLVGGDAGRITAGDVPEPRKMRLAGILNSGDTLLLRYVRD